MYVLHFFALCRGLKGWGVAQCSPLNTPPDVHALMVTRGGVEDTRLEAKAKDTKKIRGQEQPFRGQTLSRPRTGMLEAKAKDQGHKAQVLSKKKKKKRSSQKFFRRSPKKIKKIPPIPPTSLKVTILAEKSASILNNSAPFRDASPPTDLNVTNPAEKSVSILVKTFFFFFFWRPPDFGRKKRLNFRFRPKNHSQLW